MKTLILTLKTQWYNLIASGEKKEEYREIKDYWRKRLFQGDEPIKYDRVVFYLGYSKGRPSMAFKIEDIHIGHGKPEWGAKPGEEYFVISLGNRED